MIKAPCVFQKSVFAACLVLLTLSFTPYQSFAGFVTKRTFAVDSSIANIGNQATNLSTADSTMQMSADARPKKTRDSVKAANKAVHKKFKRSLASMLCGFAEIPCLPLILAFGFGNVPVLAIFFLTVMQLLAVAAIVLGITALRKKQNKSMAITGIIMGSICIALFALILLFAA